MRRLLLLRHGKADRHSAGGDRERPLTQRGEADARRMGVFLRDSGLTPDLAVASNARRARQTLDRALEAFPDHVTHVIENTIYLATAEHLLEILRQTPDRTHTLLAVGHNPGFAELAGLLACDGDADQIAQLRLSFPTAALAILDFDVTDWSEIRIGGARLHDFMTPAILRGDLEDDLD